MGKVRILQPGEPPSTAPASASPAPPPITPSEAIVRSAPSRKTSLISLDSGRQVGVRRLSPLDRMMAAKAIGSELVTNALYANYALVACSVISIEGDPVTPPTSQRQIEAIIQRVGDDFDELTEEMKFAFAADEPNAFDPDTVKN